MKDTSEVWTQFLDPAVTRPRLVAMSVYLAAYESLENTIVDRLRDFYCSEFAYGEWKVSKEYKEAVLSRNRSAKHASLDWLCDRKAIDDQDLADFEQIKKCRNEIAHKMWSLVGEGRFPTSFVASFEKLVALVRKIEVWWIINLELEINPEFDGVKVDPETIVPGPCMMLDMLRQIALGDDEDAYAYLHKFRSKKTSAPSATPR